jgi:polysaccharide pyruvyl transferase WcaK-like protein
MHIYNAPAVPTGEQADSRSPASRAVVFFGHFGAGNWGNECTLQACLHHVRRVRPNAPLICLSTTPEDTERRYGLPTVGLLDFKRDLRGSRDNRPPRMQRLLQLMAAQPTNLVSMVKTLRQADTVVMTGTGMITDWGEGPLGLPLSMFQWCALAASMRRRVLFLSVGVEQIVSPVARELLRNAMMLADYRSFRDEHSRSQLVAAGMAVQQDPLCPDLAFSLPIPEVARNARKPGTVAVGVFSHRSRGASHGADLAEYRAYVEKMGRLVLHLLSRKKRVRLVIGDTSDIAVVEDLKAWLGARESAPFESEPAQSVEQVMAQLAEAELVVATRFHNVLLALRMGIPVLSIAYEGKNDALMAAMGLGAYCQSIDSLDLAQLFDQFERLEAEAPQLAPRIAQQAEVFRLELDAQYARVFGPAEGQPSQSEPSRAQRPTPTGVELTARR